MRQYLAILFLIVGRVRCYGVPPSSYSSNNGYMNKAQSSSVPIKTFNQSIRGSEQNNYNFESGNGIRQQESTSTKTTFNGGTSLIKSGSVSYTSPEGVPIQLSWVADEQGFQPSGNHLPTPPPIPPEIQSSLKYHQNQQYSTQGYNGVATGNYQQNNYKETSNYPTKYQMPAIYTSSSSPSSYSSYEPPKVPKYQTSSASYKSPPPPQQPNYQEQKVQQSNYQQQSYQNQAQQSSYQSNYQGSSSSSYQSNPQYNKPYQPPPPKPYSPPVQKYQQPPQIQVNYNTKPQQYPPQQTSNGYKPPSPPTYNPPPPMSYNNGKPNCH